MLPVVRPLAFVAQYQKLSLEINRHEGTMTLDGMLVITMSDNRELAVEILRLASAGDDDSFRAAMLMTACAVYQALKAQAESDRMELQEQAQSES
jgi:hypothetical protein